MSRFDSGRNLSPEPGMSTRAKPYLRNMSLKARVKKSLGRVPLTGSLRTPLPVIWPFAGASMGFQG